MISTHVTRRYIDDPVMITDLCLRQVRLIMRSSFIPCMNDLGINIEHVNTVYGKGMSPSDIDTVHLQLTAVPSIADI